MFVATTLRHERTEVGLTARRLGKGDHPSST